MNNGNSLIWKRDESHYLQWKCLKVKVEEKQLKLELQGDINLCKETATRKFKHLKKTTSCHPIDRYNMTSSGFEAYISYKGYSILVYRISLAYQRNNLI